MLSLDPGNFSYCGYAPEPPLKFAHRRRCIHSKRPLRCTHQKIFILFNPICQYVFDVGCNKLPALILMTRGVSLAHLLISQSAFVFLILLQSPMLLPCAAFSNTTGSFALTQVLNIHFARAIPRRQNIFLPRQQGTCFSAPN